MTFKDAADMYFEIKKGLMKPSSYANFLHIYKKHIAEALDDIDLSEMDSRQLQKFYNSLVNKKCELKKDMTISKHSAKDIVGLVKTILYFAMDEGQMEERSFRLKTPYGFRDTDERKDFLDEKSYKKLINCCVDLSSKRYLLAKIFAILSVTTGLRIGEVCGLKWEDVNFKKNTIEVKRTVQRIQSENGGYINIGEPKTQTSKRTVALLSITKEVLKRYKKICDNPDSNTFVLTGKTTPSEPRTVRQTYQRFLKANKIDYVRPHALRHTFTTYSISNGCDVKTISHLLGHANTSITLDTYTHMTKKQMSKTVSKLNKICTVTDKGA